MCCQSQGSSNVELTVRSSPSQDRCVCWENDGRTREMPLSMCKHTSVSLYRCTCAFCVFLRGLKDLTNVFLLHQCALSDTCKVHLSLQVASSPSVSHWQLRRAWCQQLRAGGVSGLWTLCRALPGEVNAQSPSPALRALSWAVIVAKSFYSPEGPDC